MKHRIKYRVWDINKGEWAKYPVFIQPSGSVEVLEDDPVLMDMIKGYYVAKYPSDSVRSYIAPGVIDFSWFPEVVIQQWTGMVDKNGVEIYEGDLVRFMWGPFLHKPKEYDRAVVFENGSWSLGVVDLYDFNPEGLEVVGNINL